MKVRFSIDIHSMRYVGFREAMEMCKEFRFPTKLELLRLKALGIISTLESNVFWYSDDPSSEPDILFLDTLSGKVGQPDDSAVLIKIKREQWL